MTTPRKLTLLEYATQPNRLTTPKNLTPPNKLTPPKKIILSENDSTKKRFRLTK